MTKNAESIHPDVQPSAVEGLFAERARITQPSAIRDICRLVERPEMRSLAGGWPDPAAFPGEKLGEILAGLLASKADQVLQYGSTEGLHLLRSELARRVFRLEGLRIDPDELMILHGSQQGVDLASRVFIDPGDCALCGLPTYFGGSGAMSAAGAKLHGVVVDDDGMDTHDVEEKLEVLKDRGERVKAVYVIPNFQNPTGVTLSMSRREHLVSLAQKYDFMIFEDDPYGELRFEGKHLPSLYSLDDSGHSILIRSMSKTFSPGLRLGWTAAETGVLRKLCIAKQFVDACTNSLAQHLAAEFIAEGRLDRRVSANIEIYKKKRDLILEELHLHFPKQVRYNRPQGGFFVFVHLPGPLDAGKLLERATAQNVVFVAGSPFHIDGGGESSFRLSYSQADDDTIREAVAVLGGLIREMMNEAGLD